MTNLRTLKDAKNNLLNALDFYSLDKSDIESINIQTSLYQSYLLTDRCYIKEENKVKSLGYDSSDLVEILRGDKEY